MKNHRASCIKNTRGFSLIELIIVVAIMVALIAVMAPSYVKYVKKARDAVMTDAAENVVQFCKTEFANNSFGGTGTITLHRTEEGTADLDFAGSLTYCEKSGDEAKAIFMAASGFDSHKQVRSDLVYIIKIDGTQFFSPVLQEAKVIEVESTRESA